MLTNGVEFLERVEALTRLAPSLDNFVGDRDDRVIEYRIENGFAIGVGQVNDLDCAIQKVFLSGCGSVFPEHTHDEHEYIIIITGEGSVTVSGEERRFKPFDCIIIPPKAEHSFVFKTNTIMIAITVPASKGFPSGKG